MPKLNPPTDDWEDDESLCPPPTSGKQLDPQCR